VHELVPNRWDLLESSEDVGVEDPLRMTAHVPAWLLVWVVEGGNLLCYPPVVPGALVSGICRA
jgi:hypothetical protein